MQKGVGLRCCQGLWHKMVKALWLVKAVANVRHTVLHTLWPKGSFPFWSWMVMVCSNCFFGFSMVFPSQNVAQGKWSKNCHELLSKTAKHCCPSTTIAPCKLRLAMARTYDVDLSKGLNYMWLFPQFPWQRNEFLVLAEAEIQAPWARSFRNWMATPIPLPKVFQSLLFRGLPNMGYRYSLGHPGSELGRILDGTGNLVIPVESLANKTHRSSSSRAQAARM